ncbi:CRISPR-associated endonuclease Cas1 [Candidatus Hepatincola sp. Av]
MSEKIISIENSAYLSVDTSRIVIEQADNKNYVAAKDIAVLIVSSFQVKLTAAVISAITTNGGLILFTNSNYMPTSYCYANNMNNAGAIRPYLQAQLIGSRTSAVAWQQIIQSKIKGQATILNNHQTQSYNYINSAHKLVELGDATNIEAQVAKVYWQDYFNLFNLTMNREKRGASNIINICLNYGYSVIRAMVARSLASLGLCLNFGIGHYRKDNPFNLVEDFVEPFRYIVDESVYKILQNFDFQNENLELTPQIKQLLLKHIYNYTIILRNKNYRLMQGIHEVNTSYCQYLQYSAVNSLVLPHILVPGVPKKAISNTLQEY